MGPEPAESQCCSDWFEQKTAGAANQGLLRGLHLQDSKVGVTGCASTRHSGYIDTGWWFQIFFIFIPIWGNDPI